MLCKPSPLNTRQPYRFVVILSFFGGRLVLSRHKQRTTYETQGGHIEPGETPEQAARRELWEESGAAEYDLTPLCDYWAGDDHGWATGQVFVADVRRFDPLPESEMAEIHFFDTLPENLTYPELTPGFYELALKKRGRLPQNKSKTPD